MKHGAAEDLWHLSIDDLFVAPVETPPLAGPGPFVINLSASTAPISIPAKSLLSGFEDRIAFQLSRKEDGRQRYRLRLGFFDTPEAVENAVSMLRDRYPSAFAACATEDDLRFMPNRPPPEVKSAHADIASSAKNSESTGTHRRVRTDTARKIGKKRDAKRDHHAAARSSGQTAGAHPAKAQRVAGRPAVAPHQPSASSPAESQEEAFDIEAILLAALGPTPNPQPQKSAPARDHTPRSPKHAAQTHNHAPRNAKHSSQSRDHAARDTKGAAQLRVHSQRKVESTAPAHAHTVRPAKPAAPSQESARLEVKAAAPSQESARPDVKAAAPSQESARPDVKVAAPSQESARPDVKVAAPSQESARPDVKVAAPSQESARPDLGEAAPTQEPVRRDVKAAAPSHDQMPRDTAPVLPEIPAPAPAVVAPPEAPKASARKSSAATLLAALQARISAATASRKRNIPAPIPKPEPAATQPPVAPALPTVEPVVPAPVTQSASAEVPLVTEQAKVVAPPIEVEAASRTDIPIDLHFIDRIFEDQATTVDKEAPTFDDDMPTIDDEAPTVEVLALSSSDMGSSGQLNSEATTPAIQAALEAPPTIKAPVVDTGEPKVASPIAVEPESLAITQPARAQPELPAVAIDSEVDVATTAVAPPEVTVAPEELPPAVAPVMTHFNAGETAPVVEVSFELELSAPIAEQTLDATAPSNLVPPAPEPPPAAPVIELSLDIEPSVPVRELPKSAPEATLPDQARQAQPEVPVSTPEIDLALEVEVETHAIESAPEESAIEPMIHARLEMPAGTAALELAFEEVSAPPAVVEPAESAKTEPTTKSPQLVSAGAAAFELTLVPEPSPPVADDIPLEVTVDKVILPRAKAPPTAPARIPAAPPPIKPIAKSRLAQKAPEPAQPAIKRPVVIMDGPLADLDSTQTLRALTPLELTDDAQSKWFAVQLTLSEEPVDLEKIPHIDIFDEYRLYVVSGVDQGKFLHSLRLGFFSSDTSAGAVSCYMKTFFEAATVKRVSVAEHDRFAERKRKPAENPQKDALGASSKHGNAKAGSTAGNPMAQPKNGANGNGVRGNNGSNSQAQRKPPERAAAAPRGRPKTLGEELYEEARETVLSQSAIRRLPKNHSLWSRLFGPNKR